MTDRMRQESSLFGLQSDDAALDALRHLKSIDFELAYLALLTREGVKPISRWEKPLTPADVEALVRLGLQSQGVQRKVRSGKRFTETIFGRTRPYIDVYAAHFEGQAVDKSAETVRIEGFLFGYPPCCVAQYIRHPYAPHAFPTHKQEILFHWTCQGCVITPVLAPQYERVHRFLQKH